MLTTRADAGRPLLIAISGSHQQPRHVPVHCPDFATAMQRPYHTRAPFEQLLAVHVLRKPAERLELSIAQPPAKKRRLSTPPTSTQAVVSHTPAPELLLHLLTQPTVRPGTYSAWGQFQGALSLTH
jgi:hypothetical protein